jgi:hypothetical protein
LLTANDGQVSGGGDVDKIRMLRRVDVQLASLSGELLGMASDTNIIWIDLNAGGYGWNVNSFVGGIDLASVLAHEFGHILGLEDLPFEHDVMGSHLAPGELRMPTFNSLDPPSGDWLTGGSYIGSSLLASDALFAEGFPPNSRDLILFDENRTLDFEENKFELVDQRSEVAILDCHSGSSVSSVTGVFGRL